MSPSTSMAIFCAREREAGRPVYYGDASRKPILEKVGGGSRPGLRHHLRRPRGVRTHGREIRAAWPNASVLARARTVATPGGSGRLGVSTAVPETLEGSLQLGAEVAREVAAMGLPEEAVDTRVEFLRGEEIRRLTADGGGLKARLDRRADPVDAVGPDRPVEAGGQAGEASPRSSTPVV